MRILQAMDGAEYGGAEAFFVRLAIAIQKAGLDQRVLIRTHPTRAARLREHGVVTRELTFGGPLDVASRWRLWREIVEFQPDIVLTWTTRTTAFCHRFQGEKFIHVARLEDFEDMKYYRRCDHLIASTAEMATYLGNEGWDADRVHYLPHFITEARQPAASRARLSTPANARVVLGMGRLHKPKAFDTLLRAMEEVSDAYLWIAGDGPDRKALEELAKRIGVRPKTRFLGWREDTAALLAAADLFVCPFRREPHGNMVIEAWAHGVPVVAADSLGPGTLIKNGESGLLVPVDDAPAMAQAIRYALDNPAVAQVMARQGYDTYRENFTGEVVLERYLSFFEKIKEAGRP